MHLQSLSTTAFNGLIFFFNFYVIFFWNEWIKSILFYFHLFNLFQPIQRLGDTKTSPKKMDEWSISSFWNCDDSTSNGVRFLCGGISTRTYCWRTYLRTIPEIEDRFQPLEEILRYHFIPAITGARIISDKKKNFCFFHHDSKVLAWRSSRRQQAKNMLILR